MVGARVHGVQDALRRRRGRFGGNHLCPPTGRAVTMSSAARSAVVKGLRLVEGGVVGGVLDDVQRPAVAGARLLSDAERRRQVVPAPDQ